jgi:hypothetical protein
MKIIGLEEHFVTPEIMTAWQALAPELQDIAAKQSARGDLHRRLFDLAGERTRLMEEAGGDMQVSALIFLVKESPNWSSASISAGLRC